MGRYYEDVNIGEKFTTTGRTITEADLLFFAALTGDYNPIHMDEEYSKTHTIYKKRVSHGLYTLALSEGLAFRVGLFDGVHVMTIGWNNVKFILPVFIGDTLYLEFEVTAKRESKSKPTFGIVTMLYRVKNQKGTTVMEAEHIVMMPKKLGTIR